MGAVPTAAAADSTSEMSCRQRLGVPADARQVMVVTESTHWDPNWLFTSTEYFRWRVRRCLDQAIDALVAEPRRVFSLECVFFPDLYWEKRPERRDLFRTLVNEGRLRLTGSGVTTPDTLLPEDELLLRDLLIGQEWLRTRGMTQEPRTLYLPDSFGHSPGLPSLLQAAGVTGAAVTRIDGMRFPGADMEPARHFPRPGTSAEHLFAEQTADFIWRGPDGSEVLTHWMTYGYGHGDMIASGGLSRALGLPTSWPDRRERRVRGRVEGYLDQLTKVARTPYLLLALGMDFVAPVPGLVDLLDRWNEHEYPRTGVWLVNAGLDDYLGLVDHHRDRLPTMAFDPNPYWMGFYASRPDIKAGCRDLGRRLIALDNERARTAVDPSVATIGPRDDERHARAWWRAATSNHHDYVTGTSPDRVAKGEQTRWLTEARSDVSSLRRPPTPGPVDGGHGERPTWERRGQLVTIRSAAITAVFDERRGGALVELARVGGKSLIAAPSLELRSYAESGGLWRMGHEFKGGRWDLADRSSLHPAEVTVTLNDGGGLRVAIEASLDGQPVTLTVDIGGEEPHLVVHTAITAPRRRTVTLAVHQPSPIAGLLMHQPGGVVTRDLQRWYDPTFWPLHSFAAALPSPTDGPGEPMTVVATAAPTALHATPSGTVETVVARTATKELAFGVIPVLAPARGRDWGTQHADLAWAWHADSEAADLPTLSRRVQGDLDRVVGRPTTPWLVEIHHPAVEVTAVKVAARGDGLIVRLRSWADPGTSITAPLTLAPGLADGRTTITAASETDSSERDLATVPVRDGAAQPVISSHLTTIRLTLSTQHAPRLADR